MNETPLKPWVAATNEGTVVTAHCNCMAGLRGACSHIGAILFTVEAGVWIKHSTTCMSGPCKWLLLTPVISVSYQELRDIDSTSSKTKKRKLDSKISVLSSDTSKQNANPAQSDAAKNVFVPSQTDILYRSTVQKQTAQNCQSHLLGCMIVSLANLIFKIC